MTDSLVCSVVLLFNNFDDADECIDSLVRQNCDQHQIIAVDNGSHDGSYERLQEKWHDRVRFIANGANLGIAAGYNVGIRAALDAGAAYVVVCNNDVVLDAGTLEQLRAVLSAHPDAAAAVPVILYYDRPDLIWFGRPIMHPLLGYTRDPYRNGPAKQVEGIDQPFCTDYVTTSATMMTRSALEDVGLLDERFFLGHDDVDWSLRARAGGRQLIVLPKGLVRHKVSVSQGVRGSNVLGPTAAYTNACAAVLIGAKHFRGLREVSFLAGLLAIRTPYNLGQIVIEKRWPSLRPYLEGLAAGLREYGPGFFQAQSKISRRIVYPKGHRPSESSLPIETG